VLAFYACYVAFALHPIAGPRWFWGNATGPSAETIPALLVRELLERGSAYGAAFPSSHVAAAWCAVLAMWRSYRPLAVVLGVFAFALTLGTVYGQFHYGIDAIAGALLAVLLYGVSDRLRGWLGAGRQAGRGRSSVVAMS
jgi:membrane-associated phospholipid phosphatase